VKSIFGDEAGTCVSQITASVALEIFYQTEDQAAEPLWMQR